MALVYDTATLLNTGVTSLSTGSIRLAIHALQRTIDHGLELIGLIALRLGIFVLIAAQAIIIYIFVLQIGADIGVHGVHAHIQSCTAHAHHQRIHSALFQSVHIDILGEGTAIQYRCSGARINIESTMPYAHAGHRTCGHSHILEFTIGIIISFHGYGAELLLSAAQACIVQLSSHLCLHIHIAYSNAPGLA